MKISQNENKISVFILSTSVFRGPYNITNNLKLLQEETQYMEKKKVMVIDDNVTNLNIARKVLEEQYEVLLMPSGQKALDVMNKIIPDLILLDIEMPEMTGFEIIEKIKTLGSPFNRIPVIFLTGKDDANSEYYGFELGAVDYIRKPFSFPLLLKRVELHLKLDLQRKQLQDYSSSLEDTVLDLEKKNSLNKTMLECVKTLVNDDSIDICMNKLLEIITNYYGASATTILYKDNNSDNLICSYKYSKNKDSKEDIISNATIHDAINLFNRFKEDEVGYIPNDMHLKDFPVFYDIFKINNINSLLFVPLKHENNIVGFLGVQNHFRNIDDAIIIKTISAFVVNHISKNNMLNKLENLSYTDTLTGLYNRNYYNSYIDEYVAKPNNKLGVIFGDVNGLKTTNDKYGHEYGDKLIKMSADFFKENVNGLIFRIGGDEFVCILEDISRVSFNNTIDKLKTKLNESDNINISIGETWNENFENIERVITNADENMYDNKRVYYSHKLKGLK